MKPFIILGEFSPRKEMYFIEEGNKKPFIILGNDKNLNLIFITDTQQVDEKCIIPKRVRIRRQNNQIVQNCDEYIGRRFTQGGWNLPESIFHNPYPIKECLSREDCLNKYKTYLLTNSNLKAKLPILSGKTIGCFCELNENCHGDVLIEIGKSLNYW